MNDQIKESEEHWDVDLSDDEWQCLFDRLASFNEFVNVNGNLVKTELRDTEDIANEMGNGDGDGDAKVPINHSKALEALDTTRDYLQFNSAAETPFNYLHEFEKVVSVIHREKHKHLL